MKNGLKEDLINHINMVYSISFKILRNREDSEDATQDTYANVLNNLQKGVRIRSLKAYLATIAYNKSIDKKRSIRSHQKSMNELGRKLKEAETNMENKNISELLNMNIMELPEEDQLILSLAYTHEFKHREISEITGIPTGTVSRKIHELKEKLRGKLSLAGFALTNNNLLETLNKSFNETIATDIHNNIKKQIIETPVPTSNGPIWSIPSLLFTGIVSNKLLVVASILLVIPAVVVVKSFIYGNPAVYDTSNVNKEAGSSGSEENNLRNPAIASSSNEHLNLPAKNPAPKVTGVL
ncbi:MAG: sigma-70 family RNA polymerase sigma factor, partial [Planctomycetes bacterium]|nr:sigma-70 family RNA polymerase sigma factor [Planctomycetota bacterium]